VEVVSLITHQPSTTADNANELSVTGYSQESSISWDASDGIALRCSLLFQVWSFLFQTQPEAKGELGPWKIPPFKALASHRATWHKGHIHIMQWIPLSMVTHTILTRRLPLFMRTIETKTLATDPWISIISERHYTSPVADYERWLAHGI
jgi:hypothetical protein